MTNRIDHLRRVDAECAKCGAARRPTAAYIALLKFYTAPYVCQPCREAGPPPPMSLGKLGVLR